MGDAGWALATFAAVGLFVAIFLLGRRSRAVRPGRLRHRGGSVGEHVTNPSLGESIIGIVEDRNTFYLSHRLSVSSRDKVILTLLELYAFVRATASLAADVDAQDRRRRLLDKVHAETFALLKQRGLITDAPIFETLAHESYSRWNAALDEDDGTGPSGFYWMAKDVLLTIRPDQEPDIALIDALEEMFLQNCIAWAESLRRNGIPW
jgi:hypothetical protein